MTVAELIASLKTMPQDLDVTLTGLGDYGGVIEGAVIETWENVYDPRSNMFVPKTTITVGLSLSADVKFSKFTGR